MGTFQWVCFGIITWVLATGIAARYWNDLPLKNLDFSDPADAFVMFLDFPFFYLFILGLAMSKVVIIVGGGASLILGIFTGDTWDRILK